jgi:hypothetical protein
MSSISISTTLELAHLFLPRLLRGRVGEMGSSANWRLNPLLVLRCNPWRLSAYKIWEAIRGEWFAMCERITFGRHACGTARANVNVIAKNNIC